MKEQTCGPPGHSCTDCDPTLFTPEEKARAQARADKVMDAKLAAARTWFEKLRRGPPCPPSAMMLGMAPRQGGKKLRLWMETVDHALLVPGSKVVMYERNAAVLFDSIVGSHERGLWNTSVRITKFGRENENFLLEFSNGSTLRIVEAP